MKVFWGKLSDDDANGVIIKYAVCYKASENKADIDCDMNKTVNSDKREVVLDELNEASTYIVAVRASTLVGFGDPGAVNTSKTSEAGKRFHMQIFYTFFYQCIWKFIYFKLCC